MGDESEFKRYDQHQGALLPAYVGDALDPSHVREKGTHWPQGEFTQRMHQVLRLQWARTLYAHRKTQAEHPFAEIKQRVRFQRFSRCAVRRRLARSGIGCARR